MSKSRCAYCKYKKIGSDYPDKGHKRKWSYNCGLHNFEIGFEADLLVSVCDDVVETRHNLKKQQCNFRKIESFKE